MLINDIIGLAMAVPPILAAQWGVWFTVGLALVIWTRREKSQLVVQTAASRQWSSGSRPAARQRSSGSRPAARPEQAVAHAPLSGDAFGELEALFNEVQEGSHRPGETPISLELPPEEPASEPLSDAPALTVPQSLP